MRAPLIALLASALAVQAAVTTPSASATLEPIPSDPGATPSVPIPLFLSFPLLSLLQYTNSPNRPVTSLPIPSISPIPTSEPTQSPSTALPPISGSRSSTPSISLPPLPSSISFSDSNSGESTSSGSFSAPSLSVTPIGPSTPSGVSVSSGSANPSGTGAGTTSGVGRVVSGGSFVGAVGVGLVAGFMAVA